MLLSYNHKATTFLLFCTSRSSCSLMVSPTARGCDLHTPTNHLIVRGCDLRTPTNHPTVRGCDLRTPTNHLTVQGCDLRTPTNHPTVHGCDLRTPTNHLTVRGCDLRTPTNHLTVHGCDLRTPTKVSAKLRCAGQWPRCRSGSRRACPDGRRWCIALCGRSGGACGGGR